MKPATPGSGEDDRAILAEGKLETLAQDLYGICASEIFCQSNTWKSYSVDRETEKEFQ